MKFKHFTVSWLTGITLIIGGCHTHDHSEGGHSHDHHKHGTESKDQSNAHEHAHEEATPLSFTVWTDQVELFVEFPPLVVGKQSTFITHFTNMSNFKAVEKGETVINLTEGNSIITNSARVTPSSPGVFLPTITPSKTGIYQLDFILNDPKIKDTVSLVGIVVYSNEEEAIHANMGRPEKDEITFLKEQAWQIDFAVDQVKRSIINEVIHTSGEIQPMKGQQKIVAARNSGIVTFLSKKLQEGRDVKNGEELFIISSKGLLSSNIEEKLQIVQAQLDKAKADFERAEQLLTEQIIGKKEYERRKMEYSIAQSELQILTKQKSTGSFSSGQSVSASMSGILKNVMVTDGQYVEEGTPLLEISSNRRLVLHADVSQSHLPKLKYVRTANFKTSYQKKVQSLADYNGRLVSFGKIVEEGSSFIPVIFELDNLHDLLPGSFVELFLLAKPVKNALVTPKYALMQDYGQSYVYVQIQGESFEKRMVKTGIDDGVNIQLLSGVQEGEWIVTKGAYQVKMASMSSSIPSHGHAH